MVTRKFATSILLVGMLAPGIALAEEAFDTHPWFDANFLVNGGAFFSSQDYKLSAGGSLPGEDIDFDEVLGVDNSQTSFSGSVRWEFGEKWSFSAQTMFLEVSGKAELEEDLVFDDVTFEAGSFIKAGADDTIIRGFFGRKLSTGPNHEFGAGLGLHWLSVEAFVSAEINTGDGNSSGEQEASVKADLPLPNLGAWYWYSLSPRWILTSRVDWFSASIGDYSGSLWNAAAGAQFQITDHIGIGAEYVYFALNGDVKNSDWRGSLETASTGPLIYLSANW